MPRFAKAGQTIDGLKKKILERLNGDYSGGICTDLEYAVSDALYSNSTQRVRDDIAKVNVDGENSALIGEFDMPGTEDLEQFEVLNGVPVAWCAMGGDWERPLVVVLYIGDKGELRAYVPKDGNAYNHKQKCAYGSEEDIDELMEVEDYDEKLDEVYVFDADKLREDVKKRIQIKS